MVFKIKYKNIFKTQQVTKKVSPLITNKYLTTEKYQPTKKDYLPSINKYYTIEEYLTPEDYLTLTINIYNADKFLKKQIDNLSIDVDNLVLNFEHFSFYNNNIDYLNNIFTNLPVNLKTIKFIYPIDIGKISNEYGYFNLLFNIKIPLNCDLFITINKTIYNISYTEPNTIILIPRQFSESILFDLDEIILTYNSHKKIKYGGRGVGGGLMQLITYGV